MKIQQQQENDVSGHSGVGSRLCDLLPHSDEAAILSFCRDELAMLLQPYPAFANFIEDVDVHICRRADLIAAIHNAPNATLRQALFSVFVFREGMALVTDRKFV